MAHDLNAPRVVPYAPPVVPPTDLAKDGLILAGGLVAVYLGPGTWIGGAGAIFAWNSGRRLVSHLQTTNLPNGADVIAGIFKKMAPLSTFPIEAYKKKLWNATIGGLVGYGLSHLPYLQTISGLPSWGFSALGAAYDYICTDLNEPDEQRNQRAPRNQNLILDNRRPFLSRNQQIQDSDSSSEDEKEIKANLYGESTHRKNILNHRLKNPIAFANNKEFYTIWDAYNYYLDYIKNYPREAMYEVTWRAFANNQQMMQNRNWQSQNFAVDGIPEGIGRILADAAKAAKRFLRN